MTSAATEAAPSAPQLAEPRSRWPAWALATICAVAAALYTWKIGVGHVGNPFYSSAAKSMTASTTNFLFGSFDPVGVVTVDKPPMSLWPQALAVAVFGFHGWAVLLPQVVEGVAAVFLLHRTVRRWAGDHAALLAAAILALTPITVAVDRDNNPDALLVLLLVASAYAFTRSVRAPTDGARTRWLAWCAFFIGCGFLTKMLQAWIIVPAVALAYLVGTTAPVKRRVLDLLGAGAVLVASSFWWVALHAWWPGDRPYIGGSADGGAWDLIVGYNGLGRVFGGDGNLSGGATGRPPAGTGSPAGLAPPSAADPAVFGGQPGITRLADTAVGGQVSWLLPLSLLVLVAVAAVGVLRLRARTPGDAAERAGWFLWGGWLVVTSVVFSYAKGIFHPYYTTMLAPAIAAICAVGLARSWRAYRSGGVGWVSLPSAVVVTAVWASVLASREPSWHGWTRWAVLLVAAVAVVGLVAGRLTPGRRAHGRPALLLGLIAVLLVPAVWSIGTAAEASDNGAMPAAGPAGGFDLGVLEDLLSGGNPSAGLPPGGIPGLGGRSELTDDQRRVLDYARENSEGVEITLAVNAVAPIVSAYVISSDDTVIGMGGFTGLDDAPSVDRLREWTSEGRLRFVLSDSGGTGTADNPVRRRQRWIEQNCAEVDPSAYGGTATPAQPGPMRPPRTLYECRG